VPADGRLVLFGELEYEVDGIPYHLTTTFFEPGAPRHQGQDSESVPGGGSGHP
jgi:hypothetical protein